MCSLTNYKVLFHQNKSIGIILWLSSSFELVCLLPQLLSVHSPTHQRTLPQISLPSFTPFTNNILTPPPDSFSNYFISIFKFLILPILIGCCHILSAFMIESGTFVFQKSFIQQSRHSTYEETNSCWVICKFE